MFTSSKGCLLQEINECCTPSVDTLRPLQPYRVAFQAANGLIQDWFSRTTTVNSIRVCKVQEVCRESLVLPPPGVACCKKSMFQRLHSMAGDTSTARYEGCFQEHRQSTVGEFPSYNRSCKGSIVTPPRSSPKGCLLREIFL